MIAAMTFEYLFKNGNRDANNYYQRRKYEALKTGYSFSGKGLKNAFLAGYTEGIKEALDRQCTALMLVVPQEVNEKYEVKISGFSRIRNTRLIVRDGCEGDEAKAKCKEVNDMLIDCSYDPNESEDIFMSELGLEMDYLEDFLFF